MTQDKGIEYEGYKKGVDDIMKKLQADIEALKKDMCKCNYYPNCISCKRIKINLGKYMNKKRR